MITLFSGSEYMYDYYNYPQMFDGSEGEQFQKNDITEDEGFQHVTYVNNGAVISNLKSNHFSPSGVTSEVAPGVTSAVSDDVTVASAEISEHHQSDDETEDALVFLNPQFGGGNNQNQFQSPVIDFDETLSGMMGALAEIQKKGDTMLGSIRCTHLYENILGQTEFMKTVVQAFFFNKNSIL